ncbi:MAG: diguanylate cyclase, partial [candidate division Zixibacteria bacterium]|nr:GGDEF domain-containing protein [candidate division Zixibacteria bacterium]NIS44883.1 GGDEF domain-containing protein [candidate division Zixibacteria bacterium]NIU12985.1 GGDEF domain-containing protein [candidate division Zixibacteria bacterium]NIV05041.1 diguanylate cyclase [candidate division Zixibacteria bacterium]NIW43760.1 diguanylate cyclase [Gammaproteobacteria bacterium]
QARELASRDPLTGVLNRREFFKRGMVALNLAIRHKRPLSIMILDIDYFKRFNDHYGHQLGDDVLVVFGKYCKANFRKSDILGRYGGDEFIALLPETSVEQAANLARRINNEVKKIWKDDCGVNSQLGMSIGLAEVSELDQVLTLEKLIDRADRALYTAKKIGRDKYSIWQRNKVIS